MFPGRPHQDVFKRGYRGHNRPLTNLHLRRWAADIHQVPDVRQKEVHRTTREAFLSRIWDLNLIKSLILTTNNQEIQGMEEHAKH